MMREQKMKIPEIKKDLRKKLRNTINEVANRSEEIMHDEIEGFYAGGTPVYYKRTGTLGTTPQITDKYCNSNEAWSYVKIQYKLK